MELFINANRSGVDLSFTLFGRPKNSGYSDSDSDSEIPYRKSFLFFFFGIFEKNLAMFLISLLLGVSKVAGLPLLTMTVSPMKSAISLPLSSVASLLINPVNPKLTLNTIPFLATALQLGAIDKLASRNSIPMENPKFFVSLSTKSEFSFLTILTADLYTSHNLAPSFKWVKTCSSTETNKL